VTDFVSNDWINVYAVRILGKVRAASVIVEVRPLRVVEQGSASRLAEWLGLGLGLDCWSGVVVSLVWFGLVWCSGRV
jgi:hypothetical protein